MLLLFLIGQLAKVAIKLLDIGSKTLADNVRCAPLTCHMSIERDKSTATAAAVVAVAAMLGPARRFLMQHTAHRAAAVCDDESLGQHCGCVWVCN